MIFPKLILNYETSCISTSFKREISILSHIEKNIFKTATISQGCVVKHGFWANFRRKNQTIVSINSTILKLENQIVRSTTKTVFILSKKIF